MQPLDLESSTLPLSHCNLVQSAISVKRFVNVNRQEMDGRIEGREEGMH